MWRAVVDSTQNDKISSKPRVPGWESDHSHIDNIHVTAMCEPRCLDTNNWLIYSCIVCVIMCECVCGDARVVMGILCRGVYFHNKNYVNITAKRLFPVILATIVTDCML